MANNATATPTPTFVALPDFTLYFRVELISAICLAIFSPTTVVCNVLLLTTIYKDPFNSFRVPPTYFVVSLAVVDLLVGSVIEPIFCIFFFVRYFTGSPDVGERYKVLLRVGKFLSTVFLTSSFLLVLALTITQYIAITYPQKYKRIVNTRRILIFIGLTGLYFTVFSALQFTGTSDKIYYQVDLFLHTTLISLFLVISHILLYKSFRNFVKQSQALYNRNALAQDKAVQERRQNEKNFTIVTLLLSALLVLSALPHIIVFCIFLYKKSETVQEEIYVNIALRISDIIVFLKVGLDTFIYAWRLPKYRRALKNTVLCTGIRVGDNNGNMQMDAPTHT